MRYTDLAALHDHDLEVVDLAAVAGCVDPAGHVVGRAVDPQVDHDVLENERVGAARLQVVPAYRIAWLLNRAERHVGHWDRVNGHRLVKSSSLRRKEIGNAR